MGKRNRGDDTASQKSQGSKKSKEGKGDGDEARAAIISNVSAGFQDLTRQLVLKADAEDRPIWISPDGRIFLETFSPIYTQAYDFLIAVAEPKSRPELVHEYALTPYSLYAAVSVGLATEEIIHVLQKISKVEVPQTVIDFIRSCTTSYGKVKLVLKESTYYIESSQPEVLQRLLDDETIASARPKKDAPISKSAAPAPIDIPGSTAVASQGDDAPKSLTEGEGDGVFGGGSKLDEEEDEEELLSFEIETAHVESVKKRCVELDLPMLEEYDFRNDSVNPTVNIDLKPTTSIRSYQEKSLSKMFGNGRGRSGIIVLPCGAGKTLVGITATCTVKKNTLVLCTSAVSVEQWRNQYLMWSTIGEENITRLTAENKDPIPKCGIVVSTYTMISYSGKREAEAAAIMEEITNREWGLIVLDEVHVVPANMFRKVCSVIAAHCKLGLTATLVREDELITDLNFLIGPKLYEANWLDLRKNGFLAAVQCAEVWCPMTAEFYTEYLKDPKSGRAKLLYGMNPNKFHACQFLIDYHERRGDKIIVFSDNIYALLKYARVMKKPFIYGETGTTERQRILHSFVTTSQISTIFLSKVGDTSIDLPEATVIIQISSQYGSRRQEAQRLGRILRPKPNPQGEVDAFFYSLVSTDTEEMRHSTKRQQYLVDQGYSFKVITDLVDLNSNGSLHYDTKEDQLKLLEDILAQDEGVGEERLADKDYQSMLDSAMPRNRLSAAKKKGSMSALSGGGDMKYAEFSKAAEKKAAATGRHKLFRDFRKKK